MFDKMKTTVGRLWLAALALAVVATGLIAGQASAQSYSFSISPSEAILEFPDNALIQHGEAWDSPLMRIIRRSRPFIEVRNTSDAMSGQNLTAFEITIGDTDYNFSNEGLGAFALLGASSTPGVDLSSVVASGFGDDAHGLQIQFANGGLAPGEVARLQIDLDPDDSNPSLFGHPDYRTVLFDLVVGTGPTSDADNAMIGASFSPGPSPAPMTLQDQVLPFGTPVFANGAIRPYSVMEPVERFTTEAEFVIPEPSSLALMLLASATGTAIAMRKRLG